MNFFGENLYIVINASAWSKLKIKSIQNAIGKKPTKLKNKYHILKINFSRIDTTNEETTIKGFKREVTSSINLFIEKYKLNFYINEESESEDILDNLIKAFEIQRQVEEIL